MLIPQKIRQIIGWPAISLALVVAASLLMAGCSAVRLAYNQAPDLLYFQIDGYLDFNDTQALRVREDLSRLQQWHRTTQLPAYADLLHKTSQQLPDSITEAQACTTFNEVRAKLDAVLDYAQPTVLWVATQLDEDQLKYLERKQAKTNAEWKKEWLTGTPKEIQDRRFKQALDRSEMIYGSLDEPQKAVIRAGVERSAFDASMTLDERVRRQQDGLQMLRQIAAQKLNAQQAQPLMRAYMDRSLTSPNPAYQRYASTMVTEGCASFSRVHNATTPAQRAKAVQTLKGYEVDFRTLVAQR